MSENLISGYQTSEAIPSVPGKKLSHSPVAYAVSNREREEKMISKEKLSAYDVSCFVIGRKQLLDGVKEKERIQ
jgi:hypothetical protein